MADIARLFLDGARPTPTKEGGNTPKRVGPQSRAAATTVSKPEGEGGKGGGGPMFVQSAMPLTEVVASSVSEDMPLPGVMLALTGQDNSPLQTERLFAGVHALAREHHTSIGVLALGNGFFTLDMAGVESVENLPRMHFAGGSGGGGAPDMQVAHALYTYRHVAKHWIIASPAPDHPAFAQLATAVQDWLLVTATDNESVVAAYRQLKRALTLSVPERVLQAVLLANDSADAALVHSRLRRATTEFLRNDLPLATVAKNAPVAALRLVSIAVGGDDPELHTRIWTTVLDEICGSSSEEEEGGEGEASADLNQAIAQATQAAAEISQHAANAEIASHAMYDQLSNLGNVLDEEERAALTARLDEEPGDRSQKPEAGSQNEEAGLIAYDDQSRDRKVATGTIRAMEVAEGERGGMSRGTQWEAVEGSIPDLVAESELLDARPPMSWAKESCVAVDREGRMHVWTLYKDGTSWFALREWANEHRTILALTRRDLTIEKERAVAVHLVMPLGSEERGGEGAKPLLRTEATGVFVYRLRLIQWQGRRGVIVVPLA